MQTSGRSLVMFVSDNSYFDSYLQFHSNHYIHWLSISITLNKFWLKTIIVNLVRYIQGLLTINARHLVQRISKVGYKYFLQVGR